MSAKLKSMFKKQLSWSLGQSSISEEEDGFSEKREQVKGRAQTLQRCASDNRHDEFVALRRSTRRRQRSSLGVLEDILICPICKQMLQSPRMLECQHTFCKKCLEVKLEETLKNEDSQNVLRCPVCGTTTRLTSAPDDLPTNLSVESVLRAVDGGTFVGRAPDKARSLMVNFAPLVGRNGDKRRGEESRCGKCETACEATDACRHCGQVFCKVCQALHIAQLKNQLKVISDHLQATISKLEHRVVEFKERSGNLKETISKEFDAKVASLLEEKERKLELVDELRTKGENSARDIRQRILESQVELAKQKDIGFDDIADDKEKVNTFLELHRKATEMISSALTWQSKLPDVIETKNEEVVKLRDKDNRMSIRPRLLSERKDLQRPSGLALDARKADVYVACPGSGQVVVLDRQYRVTRRIQNPSMMAPQGVAFVDSQQEIFVTDKWKHTIFVFNRKGQLVRRIGEKGPGEGQFRCPEGLAIRQSCNWLYVADTGNDRVQIIGVDGSYKGAIGPNERPSSPADVTSGAGTRTQARIAGVHNFNQPTDVAVSSTAIVVADSGHHKIKVFNHRGQLMFSIGGFGTFKGLLKSPEVVKLDENGNIYVGDSDNGRVQVFSPQGAFLRVLGGPGQAVGHFGWISGLACLPNSGDVLVADSKNNTLQVF